MAKNGEGSQRAGRRRRGWLFAAVALILSTLVVAAVFWWRLMYFPADRPLTAGWAASVSLVAGDGVPGVRDGRAFSARFSDPFGVAVGADGAIYVADAGDAQRIRRITPDGLVSTLAGGGQGYANGQGASARFSTPSGIAMSPSGVLYLADTGNNAVRRITADGTVSTQAGGLSPGYRDGAAHDARFNGPVGIAVDSGGRVIVADTYNDRIRAIHADGSVTTLAGAAGPGYVDGPAAEARFDTPCGVAVDGGGNVYVADSGNGAVRLISVSGLVSSVGPLPGDGLFRPIGIAVSPSAIVYVTDDRGRIVEITPGLHARIVAGSRPGYADGPGDAARFRSPAGLALAAPGRIVVADSRNALIRLAAATESRPVRPPAPPGVDPRFDAETFAREPLLWPLGPMDGPFEITGTLGEPRGGEGGERFHAGIDVRASEGTLVRAIRPATVTSPLGAGEFGTLNESIRAGPLTYVHLRVGRDRRNAAIDSARFVASYDEAGVLVQMRVRRGARFGTGDPMGTANAFNHVHLTVGWPGEEHNPLLFRFVQFEDTVPPTIARAGIKVFREDGQPITERSRGRLIVEGRVRVVVDAWDQVNGNAPRRRLGLFTLAYQVLRPDGAAAPGFERPRETIRFDRLSPGTDAARMIYAAGSGIPFYGRRSTRLLYVVTNTLAGGVGEMGVWDTARLPPGDYTLRVLAADTRGNVAAPNRDVLITVRPPGTGADGT